MDINDSRLMLEQVRQFDHREITDQVVVDWQHALLRLSVEHVFDAIHDHFENCDDAHVRPLTPAEVLRHANQAARARLDAERRARADARNEAVFGSLNDHRTPAERAASLIAMRAGRAHVDSILAARKAARGETTTEDVAS